MFPKYDLFDPVFGPLGVYAASAYGQARSSVGPRDGAMATRIFRRLAVGRRSAYGVDAWCPVRAGQGPIGGGTLIGRPGIENAAISSSA
jgi:hypothetical protein